MRVLFITSSLTRSGGGLYHAVAGLADALAAQGVEVGVIGRADQHFVDDKAIWDRVSLRPYSSSGSYGLQMAVAKAVAGEKADLVHVHGIWTASSIYGVLAGMRNLPVVVSPHGMLDPWILARRPIVKGVHAALFEKPLMRRARIHALNEAERIAVSQFMPSAAERTFIVPNGVPDAPPLNHKASRSGALFLGRLHEKKQVLELIDAWRNAVLPDDFRLKIVGWGDSAYESAVRQASSGATNVEFVGPLHGAEKAAALANAQFFILPSVSEGLPMAVLEAIQHGCIPILTEQCNLPELARDGISMSMKTDFSDFNDVLAALRNLSLEELKKRSLKASSYSKNYRWPNVALSMIANYETSIRSNH